LHDTEFVATPVPNGPNAGDHRKALEEPAAWGLAEGDEGKIHGEGDEKLLAALRELWDLKNEGMVKAVGITGMCMPTLSTSKIFTFLQDIPYRLYYESHFWPCTTLHTSLSISSYRTRTTPYKTAASKPSSLTFNTVPRLPK